MRPIRVERMSPARTSDAPLEHPAGAMYEPSAVPVPPQSLNIVKQVAIRSAGRTAIPFEALSVRLANVDARLGREELLGGTERREYHLP
jgi:hypothetical protein